MAGTVTEVWTANPLLGNFNPGTPAGAKIFQEKIKGLPDDKRLPYSRKEAHTFRALVEAKEPSFGQCVTKIPIAFDDAGNATEHKNLVDSYSDVTIERMHREAMKIFGTAVAEGDPVPAGPYALRALNPATSDEDKRLFYQRVHRHVAAEWLKNILDEDGRSELLQKMDHYAFIDAGDGTKHLDGPTMLWFMMNKIDPSTIVGVEILRQKIETIRLHQHNNDVDLMITDIEKSFKRIKSLGGTCNSIIRYTITALRSGPNDEFNAYINCIKDNVESRSG